MADDYLSPPKGYEYKRQYKTSDGSWVYSVQLIQPSMKTWETLTVGDFVKGSYLYRILTDLGGVGDLRVLCMSDAGRNKEDDNLNECGFFRTIYELKLNNYTIVQDIPETVEVNGKKYLKSAVIERLEELDPIE